MKKIARDQLCQCESASIKPTGKPLNQLVFIKKSKF